MGANSHSEDLPEPKTPLWMPFVGATLFLLAALVWLVSQPPSEGTTTDAKPTAETKPAAEAKPAARPKGAPRPAH